jgi:uncharacterized protein YgbK (DUF1537 family)
MTLALHSFCIVADDLSGAADCAAAFVPVAGPVPLDLGPAEAASRMAVDTDSRALKDADAIATTTRTFEQIARSGLAHDLVYKKIDSTLRGHVGAELNAALRAVPQFIGAVVAPSFPQQGRTLAGGKVRIHGQAPDAAGHSADLMGMLEAAALRPALLSPRGDDPARLARRIRDALEDGARTVVVDAADGRDLAQLASALCSPELARVLVAGSAGLARALAAHVEPGSTQASAPEPAAARATGPVVAVVGSFSKASAAQVLQVEQCGDAQVIRLAAGQWLDERHSSLRRDAFDRAREILRSGRNLLVAIGGEVVQPFSPSLVRAMARVAAPLLQQAGTCVLTGGDTARAMFTELVVDRLDVCGEFEPGISLVRAAAWPATGFVLKAGGFGDALAMRRIIQHFGPHGLQPTARQRAPT